MTLRILFRMRADCERVGGGDVVQMHETKCAVERLGASTTFLPGVAPMPAGVDVVHLFNTTRVHETWLQLEQARAAGVPVVVSPIWHSNAEMQRFYAKLYRLRSFPLAAYQSSKELFYALRSKTDVYWPSVYAFRSLQRRVIEHADAVLPNSRAELEIMQKELGVKPKAAFVVPHGVSLKTVPLASASARRDVLCVGRIEPRKNTLAIIHAFKQLGRREHRLVLYGAMNEAHGRYVARVRAELQDGWVEYGGCVDQKDIYAACTRAAAVVLASFFETCGFAVMEALACGANACVSRSAYAEEYYGDRVQYCDPYDTASIVAGISAALDRAHVNTGEFLAAHTWARAGELSLRAYEHVVANRNASRAGDVQ